MIRFILISFAFLGVAFYEMSGGADFDPVELRMSRLDPVDAPLQPAEPETRLAAAPDLDTPPKTDTAVTRNASVQLASLSGVDAQTAQKPVTAATPIKTPGKQLFSSTANLSVVIREESESAIVLPSLIQGAQGLQGLQEDKLADLNTDLRVVSANRVNVRGGPGTDFGVVNKLIRGQQVEVISDPGDGWVKMRPADGGPIGWMADFLLNKG